MIDPFIGCNEAKMLPLLINSSIYRIRAGFNKIYMIKIEECGKLCPTI
jgi:hypothetical protein